MFILRQPCGCQHPLDCTNEWILRKRLTDLLDGIYDSSGLEPRIGEQVSKYLLKEEVDELFEKKVISFIVKLLKILVKDILENEDVYTGRVLRTAVLGPRSRLTRRKCEKLPRFVKGCAEKR